MSDPLDPVRAVMGAPEDIDMAGVPVAGEGGAEDHDQDDPGHEDAEDPGPGGPDGPEGFAPEDGDSPAARCAAFPLNDRGNAQRLVEHFGRDLMHVPRVGWFVWSRTDGEPVTDERPGQVWRQDPDGIEVNLKAQGLPELLMKELSHIRPTEAEADRLALYDGLKDELDGLGKIGKDELSDAQKVRKAEIEAHLASLEAIRDRLSRRRKDLLAFVRSSGNAGKIKSAVELAEKRLVKPLEALDTDPLAINCESGVLKLRVEMVDGTKRARWELLPHDRDLLMTKIMPVAWNPEAEGEHFPAFLERVQPKPAMRRFLARWFGLSTTALTGVQKLVFMHGGGGNGKSVFMELLARIMGDYAATAKIESLTGETRRSGSEATPDLVPLIGARMVRASEPEEGARLQEARVKELTGGEDILVRALNQNFVRVRPLFKLTISGNHKPEIRGGDHGIWRRVLLVPWDVQIPEAERIDKDELDARLWADREGVFRWLVEGLLEFLELGLQEPQEVLDATAQYRADSDPVGAFLLDACEITGDPLDRITAAEIGPAMNFWLRSNGLKEWTSQTINNRLAEKARNWKHPETGKTIERKKSSVMLYEGLRLQPDFRRRMEEAARAASGRPDGSGSGDDLGGPL